MCTVSAYYANHQLTVTMNRDERRQRLEGDLTSTQNHCFPTDLSSSGTWCGINRFGLIFCLLNRYDTAPLRSEHKRSRGGIIPAALKVNTLDAANQLVASLEFGHYDGFRLLILTRQSGFQHDWDGASYTCTPIHHPSDIFYSSSSVDSLRIPEQRARRYRQWQRTQAKDAMEKRIGVESTLTIPAVHLHEPGIAPRESVFMVREHTHTKSITQLKVSTEQAALTYWPAQSGFDRHRHQQWMSNVLNVAVNQ